MGNPAAPIAIATSFPPSTVRISGGWPMEDYDRLCVRSWQQCGFRILSLNAPQEIPALAARHPEVEFVPARRDANALFGRKTPFIADMMSLLSDQRSPILGIVNSDLVFEPSTDWSKLDGMTTAMVVTGHRYDTKTLSSGVCHKYYPGFDFFFFDKGAADELKSNASLFSMGLPWWDYWFPIVLALRGYDIRSIEHPAVMHLGHESRTAFRSKFWRQLAFAFAREVEHEAQSALRTVPVALQDLVVYCRLLIEAGEKAVESGTLDDHLTGLPDRCVPFIGGKRLELSKAAPDGGYRNVAGLSELFAAMPAREAASHCLFQAMTAEAERQFAVAQQHYLKAAELVPDDPGTLFACGNFFFQQRQMDLAANFLGRAAEKLPPSATLFNSLGSAMGELGRHADAAICFEKALLSDANSGLAYYNLAMALYHFNRHHEALKRLEDALALKPDFTEGQAWRRRLRDKLFELDTRPPWSVIAP